MDLSVFLSPSIFHDSSNRFFANNTIGAQTRFYFDDENDLNERQIAIVGFAKTVIQKIIPALRMLQMI